MYWQLELYSVQHSGQCKFTRCVSIWLRIYQPKGPDLWGWSIKYVRKIFRRVRIMGLEMLVFLKFLRTYLMDDPIAMKWRLSRLHENLRLVWCIFRLFQTYFVNISQFSPSSTFAPKVLMLSMKYCVLMSKVVYQ